MVFYSSSQSTATLLGGSAALGVVLILFHVTDVPCRWWSHTCEWTMWSMRTEGPSVKLGGEWGGEGWGKTPPGHFLLSSPLCLNSWEQQVSVMEGKGHGVCFGRCRENVWAGSGELEEEGQEPWVVCCCRPSSPGVLSSVVRSRMVDGTWYQVPPQLSPPTSAAQAREDSSGRAPAVWVSSGNKHRKVLPSDAVLEVKKFNVSKARVSHWILVIPCEIPELYLRVLMFVVMLVPAHTLRNRKSHFWWQTTLPGPPTFPSVGFMLVLQRLGVRSHITCNGSRNA